VAAILYRPKVVMATICAGVVLAVPWYYVVKTIRDVRPVVSPMVASSVFWGGRYLSTRPQMSAWLHYHGIAYSVWARRHPHAATRIGRG
jgi:hypothetical protein